MRKTRGQESGNRDQGARRSVSRALPFAGRLLLCLCALMTLAFPSLARGQEKNSAHDLAQRVDRHYNQLHSLRANFTEDYQGLGVRKSGSGTLLLLKPGRMRWDYTEPSHKLFLIDGKYAWFYVSGSAQVQRMSAKELDDLRSPLRFLLGHTELEKELTGLHLAGNSSDPGKPTLVGVPKGQGNRVHSVSLQIASDSGAILGIEIEETDGAVTSFMFSGEAPNAPVSADAFHFTPPAGVSVVDALPPL